MLAARTLYTISTFFLNFCLVLVVVVVVVAVAVPAAVIFLLLPANEQRRERLPADRHFHPPSDGGRTVVGRATRILERARACVNMCACVRVIADGGDACTTYTKAPKDSKVE